MKKTYILIITILLLSACAPSADAINTAIAETQSAIPTSTNTPTPTSTPSPTFTPTIIPTYTTSPDAALEKMYIDQLVDRYDNYSTIFQEAADYIIQAGDDPSITTMPDWIEKAGTSLGYLDIAADHLESIPNVPAKYEQLDSYMKLMGSETHQLVDNFARGVDDKNSELLQEAADNLSNITDLANKASAEIEKLLSK